MSNQQNQHFYGQQQYDQQLYNQQASQAYPQNAQHASQYGTQQPQSSGSPQSMQYAPDAAQAYGQPQMQAQTPLQPYGQQRPSPYGPQQGLYTPEIQQYAQPAQSYVDPAYGQQEVGSAHGQTMSQGQQTTSVTTTTKTVKEVRGHRDSKRQVAQPSVIQAPAPPTPAINYDALRVIALPEIQQQTNTSTAITNSTTVNVSGGQHRQAAAVKGDRELRRFDLLVNQMLVGYSNMCAMGYTYYRTDKGYLCGGGVHWVSNEEVDAMMDNRRPFGPNVEVVNAPGLRFAQPPEKAFYEEMHMVAAMAWSNHWCTEMV